MIDSSYGRTLKSVALIIGFSVLPVSANSGVLTLGPGLGIERVNDVFNVDLDIVRGLYRFDSGISLGAVVMFGYVDYLDVPDEGRYEAIVGYPPGITKSNFPLTRLLQRGFVHILDLFQAFTIIRLHLVADMP